ncbi:uncharacterized protein LOC127127776 isoform X2 [Lathyrus oleraceus]|uniref:uncharacterized protein LOC127127776 isoform X2 n=1 Tax=Pisum sativum TaxID=3888 RepID=UPI0021CEF940|nr:uncharacterized protein LOC127127776 isoform X2 [Pisum sativum]
MEKVLRAKSCNFFKSVVALALCVGGIHLNLVFILFTLFFLPLSKSPLVFALILLFTVLPLNKNGLLAQKLSRYRVEVEVCCDNHKFKFIFWDKDCTKLIGKIVKELCSIMIKEKEFDPHEYIVLLDLMMGKETSFKVKAQPRFKQGFVLNYKTDPKIIEHLKDCFACSTNSLVPMISQSVDASCHQLMTS